MKTAQQLIELGKAITVMVICVAFIAFCVLIAVSVA